MTNLSDLEMKNKRQNVQFHFWNIVGSAEHINIPKLKDEVKKEFCSADERLINRQISLMQTEGRIKVQEKVKVWIRQPPSHEKN